MRLILLSFICLIFCSPLILAQRQDPESNPLESSGHRIDEIGVFAGIGPDYMTGKFFVKCDSCDFDNGTGTAFTVGALYVARAELISTISWGASIAFTRRVVEADFTRIDPYILTVEGKPDETIQQNFSFHHVAKANFSFLTVQPYIKWTPVYPLFFRLGAGGSFVLNSSIRHDIELTDRIVSLSNGEFAAVRFPEGQQGIKISDDGGTATVEDGEFPDMSAFQFSLEPAIGANIRLAQRVTLSPIIQYSFPLMNVSSRGEDFRIHALLFLAELRVRID